MENIKPDKDACREALNFPNGWVYIIDPEFRNQEAVPPWAVKGGWKVNSEGIIIGTFIHNPNYKNRIN